MECFGAEILGYSGEPMQKIDIVMLAMSNLELTQNAINRILETTKDFETRILLINNGGGKEIDKIDKRNISYMNFAENQGVAGGRNIGIDWFLKSDSDYLINIDNDVYPFDNWLEKLLTPFLKDTKCGMTAPFTNYTCLDSQRVNLPVPGTKEFKEFKGFGNKPGPPDSLSYRLQEGDPRYIIGFCTCVSRKVVQEVGPYDSNYKLYGNEDADYFFTMQKLGYFGYITQGSYVYHYGSKGLENLGERGNIEWTASKRYFIKKWGFAT